MAIRALNNGEKYSGVTLQGMLGGEGGDIFIGQGDTGIQFVDGADAIVPVNGLTGADRNDLISIGGSSNKFKDL